MASNIPMHGLRMNNELYQKLKRIAATENRSYNQQAIHILQQFVEEYEKEHGKISVNTDDLYS